MAPLINVTKRLVSITRIGEIGGSPSLLQLSQSLTALLTNPSLLLIANCYLHLIFSVCPLHTCSLLLVPYQNFS